MVHVEAASPLDVLVLLLHLHLGNHHVVHHLLRWRVTACLARVPGVAEMTLAGVEHLLHAILMVLVASSHLRLVLAVSRVLKVVRARLHLTQHLAVLRRRLLVVHELIGVVFDASTQLISIVQQVLRVL